MSLLETLLDISEARREAIPERSRYMARLSLFDWLVCGRAGRTEPVAEKLRAFAAQEGGRGSASVIAGGMAPARLAALVNGATSHALDYDDTHFAHVGHLSVGIYPAALAAGEAEGAGMSDVMDAFLLGAECAIRVGLSLGAEHYSLGFHQTATAGAFGATVAVGRLMGLDRTRMAAAIALCSTRASGLKSQFGTMGKPYNAGMAASNGIECASLASLGMTSCVDGLEGQQAFLATHTTHSGEDVRPAGIYLFDENSYKFHACCHGTHAMIEALLAIRERRGEELKDIAAVRVATNPRWMRVCNIPVPSTGLEVKFSYRWLAGMALSGHRTGSDRVFTDALATDPGLSEFADRVNVIEDSGLTDEQCDCSVTYADGTEERMFHDLAGQDVENLEPKLRRKAEAMLGRDAGDLKAILDRGDDLTAADIGRLCRFPETL